jgi:hypothetical protein
MFERYTSKKASYSSLDLLIEVDGEVFWKGHLECRKMKA